jgi:xanthine dehydrogenase/oxidase
VFISQFVLGLSPPDLPANLVSGGKILERPISTGKQDYETNRSVWPLNKPVPKLEAVTQCSGECIKIPTVLSKNCQVLRPLEYLGICME